MTLAVYLFLMFGGILAIGVLDSYVAWPPVVTGFIVSVWVFVVSGVSLWLGGRKKPDEQ